ncbi:MAG: trigger factor [Clostridia bacterium]|nr:trigger factor [Clostridia bacterium]NLS84121.1 trigger factor [Oscillospiraceae bacterium]
MKLIDSKKLENNQHELQFSIDAEALNAATEKAFKREAKKYSIPGFRKGKAPRHMIEKMYGDVFRSDAINDLFPEAYESAVAEAKIEPVAIDNVEDISEKDAADVTLKVLITVKPEVTLGDYKGLKAEKKANTVDEAEVEAEIKRMQERNARIITREGAAEDGDITKIDFEGFVDGVAFDGGKAEDFSLTLGSGQFIPGFEEQIVGHSAGEEFDVNVKFPEEYQAEELAGKDATFKVKLHEIQAKELPELDDEFAKDVSEHDTLDELKNNIRTGMQERAAKENELEVENSLVDQIVDGMTVNVPAAMIESRVDDMVRDFEYRLEQQGLKLQDYIKYMGNDMKKFREGFAEQAEKQVKTRLALEAVAIKEGIEATQEDFENEIKRIADAYKMEVEKVKTLIPELEVKKDLAVNKAIDFIKSHATVTEKAADKKDSDAK